MKKKTQFSLEKQSMHLKQNSSFLSSGSACLSGRENLCTAIAPWGCQGCLDQWRRWAQPKTFTASACGLSRGKDLARAMSLRQFSICRGCAWSWAEAKSSVRAPRCSWKIRCHDFSAGSPCDWCADTNMFCVTEGCEEAHGWLRKKRGCQCIFCDLKVANKQASTYCVSAYLSRVQSSRKLEALTLPFPGLHTHGLLITDRLEKGWHREHRQIADRHFPLLPAQESSGIRLPCAAKLFWKFMLNLFNFSWIYSI